MINVPFVKFKLQSLKDQTLNTGLEILELVEGEIFEAKFSRSVVVDSLIEMKVVKFISPEVALSKSIPVLKPVMPTVLISAEGEELPLVSILKTDKIDLADFFGERE